MGLEVLGDAPEWQCLAFALASAVPFPSVARSNQIAFSCVMSRHQGAESTGRVAVACLCQDQPSYPSDRMNPPQGSSWSPLVTAAQWAARPMQSFPTRGLADSALLRISAIRR